MAECICVEDAIASPDEVVVVVTLTHGDAECVAVTFIASPPFWRQQKQAADFLKRIESCSRNEGLQSIEEMQMK